MDWLVGAGRGCGIGGSGKGCGGRRVSRRAEITNPSPTAQLLRMTSPEALAGPEVGLGSWLGRRMRRAAPVEMSSRPQTLLLLEQPRTIGPPYPSDYDCARDCDVEDVDVRRYSLASAVDGRCPMTRFVRAVVCGSLQKFGTDHEQIRRSSPRAVDRTADQA